MLITVIVKVRNQIQNGPYEGVQEFLVITTLEDAYAEVEERGAVGLGHPSQSKGCPAWAR